ncbi:uncharacterized protein B0T15DRAFT_515472 [Chaetomium strumarium]|uniref:Uncharacterized protein n=1 Tax=Chaetomium strumarium TaxID=1170767 RepID=A0AAJ0H096_9PEZI|nr:hypothetical protein B0T15DRAFT_515472 [Chaetomium strumarium]
MRAVSCAAVLLGLVSTALAQTIAPSPTESVGCEPHGDHWHCEGPRETSAADGTVTTTAAAVTTTATATVTTSAAHGDDDHDHDEHHDESGTASLAPSPTESYGCEPHGDHWHCEGAVTASGSVSTTLVTTTASTSQTADGASTSPSTAGAPHHAATGLAIAGLAAAAAAIAL